MHTKTKRYSWRKTVWNATTNPWNNSITGLQRFYRQWSYTKNVRLYLVFRKCTMTVEYIAVLRVATLIFGENKMTGRTTISTKYMASSLLLTHWGRVTHICVGKPTIIGSDNGLPPGRRQAIIWNNAGLLLIEPLETNFSEISIGIQTFSFKKMHLHMSSAKWRPFCLGLNVLMHRRLQFRNSTMGFCNATFKFW